MIAEHVKVTSSPSVGRNLVAIAAALILGVWFAFAMQMVVIGLDKKSERYGWDEIREMIQQNQSSSTRESEDVFVDIGSNIMKWGPALSFIIAPILLFMLCSHRTLTAQAAFLRLQGVFLTFIFIYGVLGWLWSEFQWQSTELPLNVTSDGIWEHIWLFIALLGICLWITRGRKWFSRPQAPTPPISQGASTQAAEPLELPIYDSPNSGSPIELTATIHAPIIAAEVPLAVIAYITFIPALFFVGMDPYRRSKYIRFHSIQSILLSAVWIAVSVLLAVVGSSGGDERTIETISQLFRIILFTAWLFAIINAGRAKWFKLPLIGNFAIQKA